VLGGCLIVVHLALGAVLAGMAVPRLWTVAAQVESGYIPDAYPIFVALIVAALVLAGFVMRGLVVWSRGSRRLLVAADVAVTVASWSAFPIFVFANDLPVVGLVLSPVALVLALLTPMAASAADNDRAIAADLRRAGPGR
jgi:hypothetical protein